MQREIWRTGRTFGGSFDTKEETTSFVFTTIPRRAARIQRQPSIPGLVSYTWKRTFVRRLWPTKSSFHGSSRAIFSNNDFTILRRGEGKKKKKIQASASTQSIAGDRGKKM